MRLRQVKRRKFKSKILESRRRQREYYYSAVSVVVVKIILFAFLGILLYISSRVFYYRFEEANTMGRFAIPVIVLIAMIYLGVFIYRDIRRLREESKNRP